MKTVVMAINNLTVAFGDVIVVILTPVLDSLFASKVRQTTRL